MAAAVGQSTLAEYLRILFQRKWWIVGISIVSIGVSIIHAYYVATEVYRYEKTIYVIKKPIASELSKAGKLPKRINDLLEVLKRPEQGKFLLEQANKKVKENGAEGLKPKIFMRELAMLPSRLRVTRFREFDFIVQYDCSNPYIAKEVILIVIDYLKKGTLEAVEKRLTEAEEMLEQAKKKYKPQVEKAYQRLKGVTPKDIDEIYVTVPGSGVSKTYGLFANAAGEATAQYFQLMRQRYDIAMALRGIDKKIISLKQLAAVKKDRGPVVLVSYRTTPEYKKAFAAMNEIKARLAEARQKNYTDIHPVVVRLLREKQNAATQLAMLTKEEKIEEIIPGKANQEKAALVESLDAAIVQQAEYEAQLKHIESVIGGKREQLKKVGEHHLEMIKATQEYQNARNYMQQFETKIESLRITQYFEIIQRAIILKESNYAPEHAKLLKPNRKLVVLLGVLVAAFMSGAMVFAAEYADHSLNTISDLRRVLHGIPVMGQISHFRSQKRELFRRRHKYAALEGRFLGIRLKSWVAVLITAAAIAGAYYVYKSKQPVKIPAKIPESEGMRLPWKSGAEKHEVKKDNNKLQELPPATLPASKSAARKEIKENSGSETE